MFSQWSANTVVTTSANSECYTIETSNGKGPYLIASQKDAFSKKILLKQNENWWFEKESTKLIRLYCIRLQLRSSVHCIWIVGISFRSHIPLVLLAATRTQINFDCRSRSSNWLWNGPMSAGNERWLSWYLPVAHIVRNSSDFTSTLGSFSIIFTRQYWKFAKFD